MKKKQRVKVRGELKEHIILASLKQECDIRLLANKHEISPNTIRRWKVAYQKARETGKPLQQSEVTRFVEVTAPLTNQSNALRKVELQFKSCSCRIEGELHVSQLLQLVQILGGSPC